MLGVGAVRHGFEHVLQELPSGAPVRCFNELRDGDLAVLAMPTKR